MVCHGGSVGLILELDFIVHFRNHLDFTVIIEELIEGSPPCCSIKTPLRLVSSSKRMLLSTQNTSTGTKKA
jgi:hypothetical protein